MTAEANSSNGTALLEVRNLKKFFPIEKGFLRRRIGDVRAVDDISFILKKGQTLSLVGESGCGKTTTARCILRAVDPTSGEILYRREDGSTVDLASIPSSRMRPLRREIQMIFQDPFSSLNPRMTIYEIVSEPLLVNKIGSRTEREDRVAHLLRRVGLRAEYMQRFPHAFSGGQRQRIGIARALAVNPRLIVADEPVSALDVSVQAQVLNLMLDLQDDLGLTYLFVSHDLSVVNQISDMVMVMYVGRIAEVGPPKRLFQSPKHPYTAALISSLPKPDPLQRGNRSVLGGEVANPASPPPAATFIPVARTRWTGAASKRRPSKRSNPAAWSAATAPGSLTRSASTGCRPPASGHDGSRCGSLYLTGERHVTGQPQRGIDKRGAAYLDYRPSSSRRPRDDDIRNRDETRWR